MVTCGLIRISFVIAFLLDDFVGVLRDFDFDFVSLLVVYVHGCMFCCWVICLFVYYM